ncbi:dna rna polymerases superfamily protein, partial [Cystoisospora suis]
MERPQKHHIPTVPGEMPAYKKHTYAMSEDHLRELKELLRVLLEKGFIVPSNSPIAAPVFFVGKKGTEKLRMVIDYRGLNRITIKDDYPIPRINDLINRLGKGSWFSKLDLASGYYQVQVAEQDQWKTTFRTRYGTFQFKMDSDIETFVKSCVACARGKASHQKEGGLLQPLPIPDAPWEEIGMDLILGLPATGEGHDAIVTIVCRLTKMAHFIACVHTISAQELAQLLVREVIRLHGVPAAIVSDRDTRFTSDVWREMCRTLHITQKMSTAYHPQTDGQAERTNQTIEQMLRCCILGNEAIWGELLPIMEFAYNS